MLYRYKTSVAKFANDKEHSVILSETRYPPCKTCRWQEANPSEPTVLAKIPTNQTYHRHDYQINTDNRQHDKPGRTQPQVAQETDSSDLFGQLRWLIVIDCGLKHYIW